MRKGKASVSSVRYRKKISRAGKGLVALLSIALGAGGLAAADKPPAFKVRPVAEYESKVTLDGIGMAVEPFDTPEKTKLAFGKVHPPQYGVMPVLLVIENQRKTAIDARRIKVMYRAPGEREIDASSALDIRYTEGPTKPRVNQPFPLPVPMKGKKNPLTAQEFEERAFAANMIGPGESASGFVYFLTEYHGQVTITVAGLRDAGRGQDIFFYEIPTAHR